MIMNNDGQNARRQGQIDSYHASLHVVKSAKAIIGRAGYTEACLSEYIQVMEAEIDKVRKAMNDPWHTAKVVAEIYEDSHNENGRALVKYVRHLESRLEHIDDNA